MIDIVATLGAPVMEAHGNSAANTSASDVAGRGRAVTVDVSCHTVSYFSVVKRAGTRTDPVAAIRPRSFRTMSTIMTFSARCFSERRSQSRRRASSSRSTPRRTVPFLGRETIEPLLHSQDRAGAAYIAIQ